MFGLIKDTLPITADFLLCQKGSRSKLWEWNLPENVLEDPYQKCQQCSAFSGQYVQEGTGRIKQNIKHQITSFKLRNTKLGLNILIFTKKAADGKWVTTKSEICTQKKQYAKHRCTDNSVHCILWSSLSVAFWVTVLQQFHFCINPKT